MPLSLLPDDVMKTILHYLGPRDLVSASSVSKQWHMLCSQFDEELWIPHINYLWSTCSYNRPKNINVLHRMASFTADDLKAVLRGVYCGGCVKDEDFQHLYMIHMYLRYSLPTSRSNSGDSLSVTSTDSEKSASTDSVAIAYPAWAWKIGAYKASYVLALRDIARQTILRSELCAIQWKLSSYGHVFDEEFKCYFYEDGTMFSELSGVIFSYKACPCVIQGDRDVPAHELVHRTMIRVAQYPPIVSERLENGRWVLRNSYIELVQVAPLDSRCLPVCV